MSDNTHSLTKEEANELFQKLSQGFNDLGPLQLEIKGQNLEINIGKSLTTDVTFSLNNLSIVFNWTKEEEVKKDTMDIDWRTQFDDDMARAGLSIKTDTKIVSETEKTFERTPLMVPEVKLKEELESTDEIIEEYDEDVIDETEELIPVIEPPKRVLPERMVLSTTTLPYDGGIWMPSFTPNEESNWTEIIIDSKLENTKWATAEQITSLSDISPTPVKSSTHQRGSVREDEDLFSDLSDFDEKSNKRTITQTRTKNKSKRTSTPPKATPQVSTSSGEINELNLEEAAANWKEPTAEENVSGDAWVKPSEVLKRKRTTVGKKVPSVPQPKSQIDNTTDKKRAARLQKTETTLSSALTKKPEEIQDWKEPTAEDNVTEDVWVKPSEILKKKKVKKISKKKVKKASKKKSIPSPKKRVLDKKKRPPPTAPDQKEDQKKGWAEW